MPRACVIVLDAVGAGDLPDAAEFGTAGSNTIAHTAEAVGGLDVPALQQLGLGNVMPIEGCSPRPGAPAIWGRLGEQSKGGMDTTTGHWEMMGIVRHEPFPTFPDGFPQELLDEFARRTGRGVLGNYPASGTQIIQVLGEEHQRTGDWIVYTSADSVFQIAAHEETIPLEELYEACRTARELLTGPLAVGRVIARPFVGVPGDYVRTPHRHDFSLHPPTPNRMQRLREAGVTVHAVGKISDIFAGQDVDDSVGTESNMQGIQRTIERMRAADDNSFVFTNLVETDMIWGHRNDPEGFANCLREFDAELPRLLQAMRHGDLLILTSDHGCDPTTPSTDHSREHALLIAHIVGLPSASGRHDGATFGDVGATVQQYLTGRHDDDLPGVPIL
jgi:phosphopentomutase